MQALVWKLQVFQQSPKIRHTHLPLILLDYLLNEESNPGTSDFIIFPESLYKSIGKKQVAGKLDKGSAYTHFSKEYKLLIAHEKVPALLGHRTVPNKATM